MCLPRSRNHAIERREPGVLREDHDVEHEYVDPRARHGHRGHELHGEQALQEAHPRPQDPHERTHQHAVNRPPREEQRPHQRVALVCEQPLPDLRPAPVGHHHGHDHADDEAEGEHRLSGDVRHLVEAAPEDVSQNAEGGGPEAGAHDAEGDEAPVGEPRGPGDERSERPNESDEAADEDRLAAVTVEVALHLLQALMRDLHPRPVALQEPAPEAAPDVEARGVAEHGADPHEADQRQQVDLSLPRDHAAGDHHRLPGRHQPHERARLEEGHHADQQIRPGPERPRDVADRLLRIRERREDPARVHRQRERQQPQESLALELQPAPAPDHVDDEEQRHGRRRYLTSGHAGDCKRVSCGAAGWRSPRGSRPPPGAPRPRRRRGRSTWAPSR